MSEVYLDNAATMKKHTAAIKAEAEFYRKINANPLRGLYKKSVQATTGVNAARQAVLNLVKADNSYTVIFSRGTTEAINLVANGLLRGEDGFGVISREDKVVVDIESHHSNILPWKMRYQKVVISSNLEKDLKGAKVIALTGVSNVTGKDFSSRIKKVRNAYPKAIIGVDGAQMVGHSEIDVKRLGVDYMAFSGHKFGAPMGIGGLIIKKELAEKLRPLNFGGEMVEAVSLGGEPTFAEIPERLEAGTLSAGAIFGLEAAVNEIDFKRSEQGKQLAKMAAEELRQKPGVKVLAQNGLIVTFQINGVHPHDVAQILADEGVMVRAGWLCAEPYLRFKGWGPVVRASFSEFSKISDVTALVKAVVKVQQTMGVK